MSELHGTFFVSLPSSFLTPFRLLEVQKYSYPRNRGLSCYYADPVGSSATGNSENRLAVYFQQE